jgi:hypothetical protein
MVGLLIILTLIITHSLAGYAGYRYGREIEAKAQAELAALRNTAVAIGQDIHHLG